MELVTRYIAAVERELPLAKQQEIARELKANIMDQIDALTEQQGQLNDKDIADLLLAMGHPRQVARQFCPPQPLINGALMPLYKNTLFMVLGILFLLTTVTVTATWMTNADMGLIGFIHGLASGFIESACFAFTTITLTFMLISLNRSEPRNQQTKSWRPEQLPKAEPGWQYIDMGDIFTDLATYLFLLIVIWYPLWLTDSMVSFISTDARLILQWASPVIVLGLVNSLWQLRVRLWCKSLLISNIMLNSAALIILLSLVSTASLVNVSPELWQGVFSHEQVEHTVRWALFIIALFHAWEVLRDSLRLRKL